MTFSSSPSARWTTWGTWPWNRTSVSTKTISPTCYHFDELGLGHVVQHQRSVGKWANSPYVDALDAKRQVRRSTSKTGYPRCSDKRIGSEPIGASYLRAKDNPERIPAAIPPVLWRFGHRDRTTSAKGGRTPTWLRDREHRQHLSYR
jgi:hypothetical protein